MKIHRRREIISDKYSYIIAMIILAFTQISFAGEAEDAVAAIFGKAQSLDVAQGNEATINEQAQNIAPHNLGEIDAQLKQLEQNYKDTFVMLKILQINRENEYEEILYKNIVTYNNSQNSIDPGFRKQTGK